MATETMTVPPPSHPKPKRNAKLPPENERYMRACSDIANALIQEYESQKDPTKPKKDINLNKLRGQIARKHCLSTQPPLTAIIAAVPEHYKKYILPKLIAKPISMCNPSVMPVCLVWDCVLTCHPRNIVWNRGGGCHVQTPPLPPYCLYRKHLCLLPWWP